MQISTGIAISKTLLIIACVVLLGVNSCSKDENPASTGTPPQAPELSSPADGALDQTLSPMLQWNASEGAASYSLQVSTNNTFTIPLYDNTELTATSEQISGLTTLTTHYWRVRAKNSYGTSNWSGTWSFTTQSGGGGSPCPGIPTVTYAGKTYNTVLIGNQCWLKENLDVGMRVRAH